MNVMEPAASLFADQDVSSDPFATLGEDNVEPASNHQHPESVHTFSPENGPTGIAGDNFPDNYGTDSYAEQTNSVNATFGETTYPVNGWTSSDQYSIIENTQYAQSFASDPYAPVGAQPGNAQNSIRAPDPYLNQTGYTYGPAYNQPVQMPSEYSQTSAYSQPYAQPIGSTQQHYNHYAPSPAEGVYTSNLRTATEIPYDSYAPKQATTTSQYALSNPTATTIKPVIGAPPPQANSTLSSQESVPLSRPKLNNAYDPPFPTVLSSRQTGNTRVPPSGLTFNSYQSQPPSSQHNPPLNQSSVTQHTASYTLGLPSSQAPTMQYTAYSASDYARTNTPPSFPPLSLQSKQDQVDQHGIFNTEISLQSDLSESRGVHSQHSTSLAHYPSTALAYDEHVTSNGNAGVVPAGPAGIANAFADTTATSVSMSEPVSTTTSFDAKTTSPPPMSPPKNVNMNHPHPPTQRPYSRTSLSATTSSRQQSLDQLDESTPQTVPPRDTTSPDLNRKGPLNTQLPPSRTASPQAVFDPYTPRSNKVTNVYGVERAASPSTFSKSAGGRQSTKPYRAGSPKTVTDTPTHFMPNNSIYTPPVRDANAPTKSIPHEPIRTHSSGYGSTIYDNSVAQEITVKLSSSTYAPSPSLIGANDPLGRISAHAPVVSFGFGGKLVTCFHNAGSLNTGFDVALSARNTTAVGIRVLKDVIPHSALDVSISYPGPLISDPGPATVGIVRPGAATQIKNKKASVVKYLDERCDEISRGLGYLPAGSEEKRASSGKLTLVRLLKIMIENDGRLTGSPQVDTAVRVALVPRLEPELPEVKNTIPAYILADNRDNTNEAAISVCFVRPSALNKIQDFLLRGERQKAYHYALDEKLWAHAMIIASSIDKDAWKEVVNEFLKNELGSSEELNPTSRSTTDENSSTRYESLRFAYSLFSGQGAAAAQELIPQTLRSNATLLQPSVSVPQATPRTPNFSSVSAVPIPSESLTTWAETVAMIISSPLSLESSAALTALGDQLMVNHWIEAAHVCYLLSPQTSAWGGVGNPAARIILVGTRNLPYPGIGKEEDTLILSEIAEFALSLVPVPKGQESFIGLPHLQAYRFIRATNLAELGYVQLAGRYCEAIKASTNRGSPYFTVAFLEQLKGLADRINGVSHADKSGSWMGGKISKPSLDSIGGWFENRFTKLVTGDAETPTETQPDRQKEEDRGFAGPFSHYSTISLTPSARSSPQPTTVNLNALPPYRTNSAMSMSGYTAQAEKPPYIADSMHGTSPGSYSSSGIAIGPYQSPATSREATQSNERMSGEDKSRDNSVQEAWWGSGYYADTSETRTPTTATFMQVDPGALDSSSEGFISLMDTPLSAAGVKKNSFAVSNRHDVEEDDLGLGNSKPKRAQDVSALGPSNDEVEKDKPIEKSAPPERPELKPTPAASGSWLSRWWKRDTTTPGPIKASLGEESTFYYDKDLKRWVNKKAGAEENNKPTIPPPPPRAQTASPGMTGPRATAPPVGNAARSASAIDLTTSPSKPAMRVRSNLVPPPESAPSTPTGSRLTVQGPPPGRPKSQASGRRNARSRYVDIFAQENGGA